MVHTQGPFALLNGRLYRPTHTCDTDQFRISRVAGRITKVYFELGVLGQGAPENDPHIRARQTVPNKGWSAMVLLSINPHDTITNPP